MIGSDLEFWAAGQAAARRSLERLVIVMVPMWSAAILFPELTGQSVWPVSVVVSTSVAILVGLLCFIRTRRAELLLIPMLVSLAILVSSSPQGTPLVYSLWIGWLNLICVVIGALVAPLRRAAVLGVVTTTGAVLLSARLNLIAGLTIPIPELLAIGVLAVGDCMVVAVCADVMRNTGELSDLTAARRARANANVARFRARQTESMRVTRLLHDTVVNTLGAVARYPGLAREAVSKRCRADLLLMDSVRDTESGDPRKLLTEIAERSRLLGLGLDQEIRHVGPNLDPDVYDAVIGASREVLNNIAKHSGVENAKLKWDWDGRSGLLEIADAGVGFNSVGRSTGGAYQSVRERCTEAGVNAVVESEPGAGTRVAMSWSSQNSANGAGTGAEIMGEVSELMARVVIRILLVFGCLGLISLTATPIGLPMLGTLLTLAILAVLGVATAAIRDRRIAPSKIWWGVYPLGAMLCTALPSLGMSGCLRAGVFWWGGVAGLAFASAATMLSRRPSVAVATAVGYLIGGALAVTQIGPGAGSCAAQAQVRIWANVGAFVAMWALARQLRRSWALGRAAQEQLTADLARASHLREVEEIRNDLLGFAHTVCESLLGGLASGDLDPRDPSVRGACARAEATLRTFSGIRIGDTSENSAILAQSIIDAHNAGVTMTMGGDPAALSADHSQDQVRTLLGTLVPACQAGAALRLTVIPQQSEIAILALIDRPATGGAVLLAGAGWALASTDSGILAETTIANSWESGDREPEMISNLMETSNA